MPDDKKHKTSKHSKKDHKDHKKHKKDKKERRHAKKGDHPSESDSAPEDTAEPMWVEKNLHLPGEGNSEKPLTSPQPDTLPPGGVERDSWMTDDSRDFSLFGLTKQKAEKPMKRDPEKVIPSLSLSSSAFLPEIKLTSFHPTSQLFVSDRELNPHLKAGVGLDQYPSEDQRQSVRFGDSGSNWRMMKLKRVMEQARESGRSVEEVGLEKYG
ncbi:hypothetical protein BC936DRAFT_141439, partial [Jimgerdemannia flammicorona]